ncbi:hypothetical protein GQR58_021795 [Nymphon striatum]|nr:hypothetical protein GQR58_021795 [Nymphon striatum]
MEISLWTFLRHPSEIIDKDEVIADHQIKSVEPPSVAPSIRYDSVGSHVPLQSTNSIFSPRTPQDMNTGYLSINDIGATKHQDFRDDPDDLTHLAPTPGDACIPLDISAFSDDNLEKWMLTDPPSCQQELSPLSDSLSPLSDLSHSPLRNDPFLSYRDDIACDDDKSHEIFKDLSTSACNGNYEHDSRSLNQTSPPELLLDDDEGFGSLPLGDFPSISVTDSILWNNSTDQCLSTSKTQESNEELSTVKYSNLARLLQAESTEKSTCKITGFKEVISFNHHDQPLHKNKIAHQAKRGDNSSDQKAQYTLKNCHRSCCNEKSENSSCDKNTFKSSIKNLGKNCPCFIKIDENSEQSTLKRHSNECQEKCKINKKVKRNQNSMLNGNKESVLMNLLINGHDSGPKYNCNNIQHASKSSKINTSKHKESSKVSDKMPMATTLAQLLLSDNTKTSEKTQIDNLVYLTCEDTEVNAPIQSHDGLLTGKELLNALEFIDNNGDAATKIHAPT